MLIAASVQLPVKTKDPREAVTECICLLRGNTISLEGSQVHLGLTCTSDCGVLIGLAELLPSATLGFRTMRLNRALTAGQFVACKPSGLSTFSGVLTEHLLPVDALALVERLLLSSPRSIRSTSFDLRALNLRWKGAPPDVTGSLGLSDMKIHKWAKRFSLSASLQIPAENPKSPEVKDVLKKVADATGILSNKGRVLRFLGEKGRSLAYGQALLVGQVCFEETIEDLADKLPKHWISEFAPNALAPSVALSHRMEQWGAASDQKINLASLLKNAVKQFLPEFKFAGAHGELIYFSKCIQSDAEALLLFEKQLPRMGKAFTLALGIRSLADPTRFAENIFQIEGTTERKTWIYSDASEAETATKESVYLAKELLPHFESSLKRYFEPWPKEIPAGIEQHGSLTARQAFVKADALALSRFPDAALIRIHNNARSLALRDIQGPELSLDGRLIQNAVWWFHFYSAASDVSFAVTVPALGRVRILDHGEQYRNPNSRYILVPVGKNWIDSDQAFALAEQRGGQERRSQGKVFGLFAKLQMTQSQKAYWAFMYGLADERGRNDLIVNMDAITGEPLPEILGF